MSDQDVDAQTYSKIFALTLRADSNLAFKFSPSSVRHVNTRIINGGANISARAQADYFMTGHTFRPAST